MSKILFLGDFYYSYERNKDDLDDIAVFIQKNNYNCILNLEAPLSCNGRKRTKIGPCLYQSGLTLGLLKKMNVIGVTLANNHICDFQEDGLLETIKLLDENGIKHTGAGRNLDEACLPMMFKFGKDKFSIYNYGWNIEETKYAKKKRYGCAPLRENIIVDKQKKRVNDAFLIDVFHWGFEYNLYPQPTDIDLAHKLVKDGAGLIIGHHPHVIQPHEKYKEIDIYYSLGNFYFSDRRDYFNKIKFSSNIIDRCNYGLGIVFDTDSKQVEKEIVFYYDAKLKKTMIIDDCNIVGSVLTQLNENIYKSKNYKTLIEENRINNKPIFTGARLLDTVKRITLKIYYTWCILGIKYPRFDKVKKKIKSVVVGKRNG